MSVDNQRRKQFKQPKKHGRGNNDPANSPPSNAKDKGFGMMRADPHDPYDKDKGKKWIDGWGHKDFDC